MADAQNYTEALGAALKARADWLEKTELPKLKEELRGYHTGFASLYNMYLKKGLIHEDPYKAEAKIGELEVPDAKPFNDASRLEELTKRLAAYDNQLDFLVNFYQFSPDFLTLDRIKRILGLVKYIDWIHLTPDSQSAMTKAAAEMTNQIKTGSDQLTMSVISESLSYLNKCYGPIMTILKELTDYRRELFKCDLRDNVAAGMSKEEASQAAALRKKFARVFPGEPFYPDLAEEMIKEDFSAEGPALREKVLKSLAIAEEKPKTIKHEVSFKTILLEGIQIIGASAGALTDMAVKSDENHALLQNKRQGFWAKLKKVIAQALNKEPEPVIYDVDYNDPVKGTPLHEKINYAVFRGDLEKKLRTLQAVGVKGPGLAKLEGMPEEKLITFFENNIREVQSAHKVFTALDEFFKTAVDREDREKVRGIKPELSTVKNSIIRANSKRHEYSAQKEEEEELKKLGVKPID